MAGKMVYVKMNKTKAGQLGHWKESKKIETVTTYLSTGSNAETSRLVGVPIDTLNRWKTQPWWKEFIEKIRQDEEQQLDNKLSKVVDKALDNLLDRIENGEFIYDQKTGRVIRTPAKLRDLNAAFNNVIDKRQLLRKQPTKIVEQQGTATQLQALAESFAKFVNKQIKEPEMPYIASETVQQNEDGTWEIKE